MLDALRKMGVFHLHCSSKNQTVEIPLGSFIEGQAHCGVTCIASRKRDVRQHAPSRFSFAGTSQRSFQFPPRLLDWLALNVILPQLSASFLRRHRTAPTVFTGAGDFDDEFSTRPRVIFGRALPHVRQDAACPWTDAICTAMFNDTAESRFRTDGIARTTAHCTQSGGLRL